MHELAVAGLCQLCARWIAF